METIAITHRNAQGEEVVTTTDKEIERYEGRVVVDVGDGEKFTILEENVISEEII